MAAEWDRLAAYACRPEATRGRLHAERHVTRGPRDAFQRDRDRIIHSVSFRRLRQKTQVFVAPEGDHYRVRLTHSLEVAQIGRSIARVLGLNEDLTEALCLAHDIGHPPFGHAGEHALDAALADHGGFDHNGHTLRTLMQLERTYPYWDGLNLSWETLEGLAKHNGPVLKPSWEMGEADRVYSLNLPSWPSLEAQIAAVADDIAYDNHDIDDGLRAGLLTLDDLMDEPFIAATWERISNDYADVEEERRLRELVRDQIGQMANDVIEATQRRIAQSGVGTPDEVRGAGVMIGGFSDDMQQRERALKRFMYARLYHHPRQLAAAEAGRRIVAGLFAAYRDNPAAMGGDWFARLPDDATAQARHVGDYIAGMTDRYAMDRYIGLFGEDEVVAACDSHALP